MSKIIHISHTDLDGYGCHLISSLLVNPEDVKQYNIDYGSFLDILEIVKINKEDFLLITDINLNEEEALKIDEYQKEIGFVLKLLDHHKTGEKQAEKYDWYNLNTEKCGTLLTFEFFETFVKDVSKEKLDDLRKFSNIVNAYDMWKENDPYFNKGKLLDRIIYENRRSFPVELKREERKHILSMLYNTFKLFETSASVSDAEFKKYVLERKLFIDDNDDNPEITLHEVKVEYFTDKIMAKKPYEILKIDGLNIYLFTGLSRIFQIFSNKILRENKKIDVAININQFGFMSIRARRDDVDMGKFAEKYFGGGGHPQAAGGSLGLDKGERIKDDKKLKTIFKEKIKEINEL